MPRERRAPTAEKSEQYYRKGKRAHLERIASRASPSEEAGLRVVPLKKIHRSRVIKKGKKDAAGT